MAREMRVSTEMAPGAKVQIDEKRYGAAFSSRSSSEAKAKVLYSGRFQVPENARLRIRRPARQESLAFEVGHSIGRSSSPSGVE